MELFLKNQDEVKLYVPANVNNDFESIRSSIENAQLLFIKPVLGDQLYNELLELHNGETEPSDLLAEAIVHIQRSLAHFAYHIYAPYGQVQITDSGFQIESTQTHKQAFQWMIDKIDEAFLRDGYIHLEELLKFLYANQNEDDLSAWISTEEHTTLYRTFIRYTSDCARSLQGRAILNILRPTIHELELTLIPNSITTDLTDELLDQVKNNDVTPDNSKLLPFIRRVITHEAIARCYDEFMVEETTNGLILRSLAGTNGDNRKVTPADVERISIAQRKAKEKASAALLELRTYLNKNATSEKYPDYFNSDLYQAPTDETPVERMPTNSANNKSFRV